MWAAEARRTSAVFASRAGLPTAFATLFALIGLSPDAGAASPQTRLDAQYAVSLAGIPIGSGTWKITLTNGHYSMEATGKSAGLLQVFASGHGNAKAQGVVRGNRIIPSSYAVTVQTGRKTDMVRMGLAGGTVNSLAVDPPARPNPNHVPLTEAHKHGVVDPFSAGLLTRAGTSTLDADVCRRTVPVFDGRQRFDLALSFKRMDHVKAAGGGYIGPVVVCSVRYNPIGGHDKTRFAAKFLRESRDIEIWYAPILGTRFVAVYRLGIPTAFGYAVLQATRFVSASSATRAGAEAAHGRSQ